MACATRSIPGSGGADRIRSIIEIRNLSFSFASHSGAFRAVDGFDLTIAPNEIVAIVGESGSGKSVAMLAVVGLLHLTATVRTERIPFRQPPLLTPPTPPPPPPSPPPLPPP